MNIELEAKRRTTINALKAAENLRNIIESSEENIDENSEYKRIVDIRSELIVKLILLYYPYVIDDSLVMIKIDGVTYAIPLDVLQNMIPEEIYKKLLDGTYINPDDYFVSDNQKPPIDLVVDANNVARRLSTEEYAFIGLTPGCGTTHSALLYASILSDIDKTAYVELNGSCDICALGKETSDKGKITFESKPNLDAYYGYDYKDFVKSYRDLYSFVVIDFGFLEDDEPEEDYIRAQNRFIVSSSAKWSLARLFDFEDNPTFNTSSCIYLFPMPNTANIETLKNSLCDRRIVSIPFCENPLAPTEDIAKMLMKNTSQRANQERKSFMVNTTNVFKSSHVQKQKSLSMLKNIAKEAFVKRGSIFGI